MKLKFDFKCVELCGDMVAVPVNEGTDGFHGVIKLNDTGAAIVELLREETNEKKIVEAMLNEYEVEEDVLVEAVHAFVSKLIEQGVVE